MLNKHRLTVSMQSPGISFNFCIVCLFIYLFTDGIFGMSEDEAMLSDNEDGEGQGQGHQSQLPTPTAEKLLCLNRLAAYSNAWHYYSLFLYKQGPALL